eukprot:8063-Heterococcus_DN1.PRE.1
MRSSSSSCYLHLSQRCPVRCLWRQLLVTAAAAVAASVGSHSAASISSSFTSELCKGARQVVCRKLGAQVPVAAVPIKDTCEQAVGVTAELCHAHAEQQCAMCGAIDQSTYWSLQLVHCSVC